jgi:HemY protein
MRWLFWILAIAAVAVGLTLLARGNEGFVLLVLPPYRVELSLNLAIALAAGALIAGYVLLRALAVTVSMPARVRAFQQRRRQNKARAAFSDALRNYFEGRFGKARRAATAAITLGESEGLAAVLAARSAHGMRAYAQRDEYLAKAAELSPEDAGVRLMAQAEMLLDERRYHDALEVLRQLPEKHTAALKLELRAQQLARNWDEVLKLLPLLEKRKVFEMQVVEQVRRHAYIENLKRKALDADALREYWSRMPADQRKDTRVAATAARCFIGLGACTDAHRVIESALAAEWDAGLLALYSECVGDSVRQQLERAESWLAKHPRDAVLMLVLGRLCAHMELWGKAQSYLEASVSIEPGYSAHLELARLLEKTGNAEKAAAHYREALSQTLSQLEQATGGRRRAGL